MKVLYVYDNLAHWGGIERVFVDKMNYLASESGYEVYLLTTNQGNHPFTFQLNLSVRYEDLAVQAHLQYRYKGLRRYWERFKRHQLLCRRLREKITQISPDIIVSTTSRYIPELVKLKGSAKLVAESHSGYDNIMEFDVMTLPRLLELNKCYRNLKQVDVLVALTKGDTAKWRTLLSRAVTIPNIVHLNISGRYSSCENKRVIFVGRFVKQKAIPDLLRIWQLVHQRHPDWQLNMYGGESEHKESMINAIRQLDANIMIHEPSSDIHSCYCEASLLMLTSLYEPFGLVIPEAMSCGIPVVSFEGDGPCDIITDGKDGFIVRDRRIEVFVERVCQLIENVSLRKQMGQEAIKSSQRFAADKIMPKWKALFDTLVNDKKH